MKLVSLDAQVLLVDSLIPEYGGNLYNIAAIREQVEVNISDVRDEYSMAHLIEGRDYLFNLAGQTSHLDSMQDPFADLEINGRAQLSILEACRTYNPGIRIVFASTRQIYGKPDRLPVDETHPLRPVDINGINKIAAESYHILYNDVYGVSACALRLTNTIGPRMRIKDARQTFVGIWIRLLLQGEPFEVWGGQQLRDFTYVDDAVDAFLLAASSDEVKGRTFNLGGDCVVSLREMAELLVEVNGGGEFVLREFPAERARIDIGDYYSDYDSIRATLGWEPRTPLRMGIENTLRFYRESMSYYL
jgi:UDP-glucose 4-epimerase